MGEHIASTGTHYNDADIDRWIALEESDEGYTGGHVGSPMTGSIGRPRKIAAQAAAVTIEYRDDPAKRDELDELAAKLGTTRSQLIREATTKLLAEAKLSHA